MQDPTTKLARLQREHAEAEKKMTQLQGLSAKVKGGDYLEPLEYLTRTEAEHQVDILERLLKGKPTLFSEIFFLWSRVETKLAFSQDLEKASRTFLAEGLKLAIWEELEKRKLTDLILNGTTIRATETSPVEALCSLMAGRMYGTLDAKIGLPSGRWVTHEDVRDAVKEMILPPLVTPNNIEVAMMSLARFAAFVESPDEDDCLHFLEHGGLNHTIWESSRFRALSALIGFGVHWRENAFARLEMGHRLAAALMFTDAPDPVQAPWPAWSLILPDGLLGEVEIRRVWCVGDVPAVLLIKLGDYVGLLSLAVFMEAKGIYLDPGPFSPELGENEAPTKLAFDALGPEYEKAFQRAIPLLRNLIRGVCLTLSDPSEWRKGHWQARPSGSEQRPSKVSKHKELPVGERYVLGHPVKIDLRDEVLDHIRTGRVGGGSPTKLFLVRGHHRQQAHGHGRLQRRTIWIEPFWKGPEDARVLLRNHQT